MHTLDECRTTPATLALMSAKSLGAQIKALPDGTFPTRHEDISGIRPLARKHILARTLSSVVGQEVVPPARPLLEAAGGYGLSSGGCDIAASSQQLGLDLCPDECQAETDISNAHSTCCRLNSTRIIISIQHPAFARLARYIGQHYRNPTFTFMHVENQILCVITTDGWDQGDGAATAGFDIPFTLGCALPTARRHLGTSFSLIHDDTNLRARHPILGQAMTTFYSLVRDLLRLTPNLPKGKVYVPPHLRGTDLDPSRHPEHYPPGTKFWPRAGDPSTLGYWKGGQPVSADMTGPQPCAPPPPSTPLP